MIQSLDTYLYEEIEERLKIILSECYIIDEALKGLDLDAQKAFKETYCGENAKEIRVSYEFPQDKLDFHARYVVSLGGAAESRKSIGGVQGSYTTRDDDVLVEEVNLKVEGDKLVFDTSQPVGAYLDAPDISFADSDEYTVKDGKAFFNYYGNETLEGKAFKVIYSSLLNDDKVQGLYKGYQSMESVGVVGISTNMDIARCLDAILKVILITLRDSLEEKHDLMLQRIEFADMQPVIEDGETLVFGRPCTVAYEVTNSVSFDLADRVKEIIVKNRGGKIGG